MENLTHHSVVMTIWKVHGGVCGGYRHAVAYSQLYVVKIGIETILLNTISTHNDLLLHFFFSLNNMHTQRCINMNLLNIFNNNN